MKNVCVSGIICIFCYALIPCKSFAVNNYYPVVTYHLSFETADFFEEEFIAQSGTRTIEERHIDFPEGKYGKGIRMNAVPRTPDYNEDLYVIQIGLITEAMFYRGKHPMAPNEPLLWGTGKMNPRLGAVAFWIKGVPDKPGHLFEQTSVAFGYHERALMGIILGENDNLGAYIRDARYIRHEVRTQVNWESDNWHHIVLNWDWANGLELWFDGDRIASSWGNDGWFETLPPGLFHFPASGVIYDELYLMDRPLTREEIARLIDYNAPPGPEKPSIERSPSILDRIVRYSGADMKHDFPSITPDAGMTITEIWPIDASDEHIPGLYVIDGRNELAWPHEYGVFTTILGDTDYHADKVDISTDRNAVVNYVTLTGNLDDVTVRAGFPDTDVLEDIFSVPSGERFFYGSRITARNGVIFRIPFTIGYGTPPHYCGDIHLPLSGNKRIHEVGLFHVGESRNEPDGERLNIAPFEEDLEARYAFALRSLMSRDERKCASASANPAPGIKTIIDIGSFQHLNIMSHPFEKPTGVISVTLSLPVKTGLPEEAIYVRIHDPAVPSRMWNQFALTLKQFQTGPHYLNLTIDFHDLVMTGGDRLWIDIGTPGICEVTLWDRKKPATMLISTVHPYRTVDAYAEKEIVPAQAQYSKMYEFMPWKFTGRTVTLENPYCYGGPFDILLPALAVRRVKPNHFLADFLETMSGSFYTESGHPTDISKVALKTISDSGNAPDWAIYMRDYNSVRKDIATWWYENQNSDGQIGGGWNDDTLFLSRHMDDLPLDGNAMAQSVINSIHADFEKTGIYTKGYCAIKPMDRLHAGDFISERYKTFVNNLGQAYPAEREMKLAWHAVHPEQTPMNYWTGEHFLSAVNVLKWYWGQDMPNEPYKSPLLDAVTENLRLFASVQNDYTFYRHTGARGHSDDNIPFGSHTVYRYVLGGDPGTRWDAHVNIAVMWPSGGGSKVPRIILHADKTSLKAICYSFYDVKRDLKMRLCRIQDGRYRIGLYSDPQGKGEEGATIWETTRDIRYFDTVILPVPPKTPLVIKVDQLEPYDRPSELPDLAIDNWEARFEQSDILATVHNIGNSAANRVVVRLLKGEETIQEKTIEHLEAPTDFQPKFMTVRFANVPRSLALSVVIDPDNTIREILEENNYAPVQMKE